jgi:hypothetical protein
MPASDYSELDRAAYAHLWAARSIVERDRYELPHDADETDETDEDEECTR